MQYKLMRSIKAHYIGPEHPALDVEKEVEIMIGYAKTGPALDVMANEGITTIGYPSLKKFLEQWRPEENWERKDTVYRVKTTAKNLKPRDVTRADAGAVIYTEIVSALNRYNGRMAQVYKDDKEWMKPEFSVALKQFVYDEETQDVKNLYGAGVLEMHVKQFGLSRIVYQEGISFVTERELNNINAYAPQLYVNLLDALVESALLYILALNPDNPENVKAVEDAQNETKADDTGTDGK